MFWNLPEIIARWDGNSVVIEVRITDIVYIEGYRYGYHKLPVHSFFFNNRRWGPCSLYRISYMTLLILN